MVSLAFCGVIFYFLVTLVTYIDVKSEFVRQFEYDPVLVRAPGRINLIGEHTDYNQGWVLPAAINQAIYFAIGSNGTSTCRISALEPNQSVEFKVSKLKHAEYAWADYIIGTVEELGLSEGFDMVFGGNIAIGAGLSSSAALTCGAAWGLNHLFVLGYENEELVLKAQSVENNFIGLNCGIMDQTACLFGKENHLILLDCQSQTKRLIRADFANYTLLLCDSRVKHSLAQSQYNIRRKECEQAVVILNTRYGNIISLRDVSLDQLFDSKNSLSATHFKRAKFVIEENRRVHEAVRCIAERNFIKLGELLWASQEGLKNEYQVSCDELDFLVGESLDFEGVLGARMMGGGFGGCTINLVRKDTVEEYSDHLVKGFSNRFGHQPEFYNVILGGGVTLVL